MTEKQKRLADMNGTTDRIYGDLVNKYVRERYSISEEMGLFRQKEKKPDEYAAYDAYVESCKSKAKKEICGG